MCDPNDYPPADDTLINEDQARKIRRSYFKVAALVVGVALVIVIVHYTSLKSHLADLQSLKLIVLQTGVWAPLIFVAISGLAILIGAPRLPFCMLGGMIFGLTKGLALSQIGTVLGAYGPFLFARFGARKWVKKRLQKMDRLQRLLKNPTILDVFLIRQLPIWGFVTNLFLGSVGVSHLRFVLGSLLGFLPQAVIFTLIGAGLTDLSTSDALSKVWATVPLLFITAIVVWKMFRNRRRPKTAQHTTK